MTQLELARMISKRTHLRTQAVVKVLRALNPVLCEVFEKEDDLRLSIGVFECVLRAPKAAYDFQNKKKIVIPPTSALTFKPTVKILQTLKDRDISRAQLSFNFDNNEK
jgi:nucleoid DNA-binding protein